MKFFSLGLIFLLTSTFALKIVYLHQNDQHSPSDAFTEIAKKAIKNLIKDEQQAIKDKVVSIANKSEKKFEKVAEQVIKDGNAKSVLTVYSPTEKMSIVWSFPNPIEFVVDKQPKYTQQHPITKPQLPNPVILNSETKKSDSL